MVAAIAVILVCSLAWVGLMAWGVILAWRGIRGELVDRKPRCGRCGYMLISDPHRPVRCSECGSGLLGPGAVRLGARRRRMPLVGGGLVILAGGGTLLWYALLPASPATPVVRKIARPVVATLRGRASVPPRVSTEWESRPSRAALPLPRPEELPALSLAWGEAEWPLEEPPPPDIDPAEVLGALGEDRLEVTSSSSRPGENRDLLPRLSDPGLWTWPGADARTSLDPGWSVQSIFGGVRPPRPRRGGGSLGGTDLRISVDALDTRLVYEPVEAERIEPEPPRRRSETARTSRHRADR
jgi:hypothetical protein